MTTLLGIDLGERRVGLAVAEGGGGRARPLRTLARGATLEADVEALKLVVAEVAADELIVGLPLEGSGATGAQAELTMKWARAVADRLGLRLALRDERLTSHLAEERLGRMPRGRSGGPPTKVQRDRYRARVDREAAAIILQDELDARAALSEPAPGADGGR